VEILQSITSGFANFKFIGSRRSTCDSLSKARQADDHDATGSAKDAFHVAQGSVW
jgi:hypothetical protein